MLIFISYAPNDLLSLYRFSTCFFSYLKTNRNQLGDFAQAYYIRDDYFMLDRHDQYCGIIQRVATGFDLFLLQGMLSHGATTATRLQSWTEGFPSNMRSTIAHALLKQGGMEDRIVKLKEKELLEDREVLLETFKMREAIKGKTIQGKVTSILRSNLNQ